MSLQTSLVPFAAALREELAVLDERRKKLATALTAAQALCEHHWRSAGEDSHHRYFCCEVCGKEDRDV